MKKLPEEIFKQHALVLGKTGSGKSSVMRLMVEGLLDSQKHVCIIDPKGDWWGLKSQADGKHAGYKVIIFGGEHADIAMDSRAGAAIAELVGTGNRPCIIDLSQFTVGERTRFFMDFASTLFKKAQWPLHLVIDEVHNFAPQGKVLDPDAGKLLHWTNRLASEGRGKGITLLSASQRPQKVHKDFVTCSETLIAMRVIHPLDRKAVQDWISGAPDFEKGGEVLRTLASMPRGEGWVWSPEIGFGPERVKFPLFSTYDSFKAPTGPVEGKLKGWAEVDLEAVKTKLASVVKEAADNDPKLLKAEIARLAAELAKAGQQRAATGSNGQQEIEQAHRQGYREAMDECGAEVAALRTKAAEALTNVHDAVREALETIYRARAGVNEMAIAPKVPARPASATPWIRPPAPEPSPTRKPAERPSGLSNGNPAFGRELPKVNRAFLTVMAQHRRPLTRNQVAIFAGYSSKSGHVDNTLGALRSAGYATGGRDGIEITAAGLAALGEWEPLPTGKDLRDYWCRELDKAQSAMFAVLCQVYPDSMTRDQVAEAAGYSKASGHVDNTLGALRSRDLIVGGRNAIKASDTLF